MDSSSQLEFIESTGIGGARLRPPRRAQIMSNVWGNNAE